MSSTIWMQCAGAEQLRPLSLKACRLVEAQHRVSTLKLVDSLEEQALLEDLIEGAKPPLPQESEFENLHYLLATPFRYPPLRYGSRFGRRDQRGLWYGSTQPETALAEVAYYRLLFLAGSDAALSHLSTEHTLFRVPIETTRGIDLTQPPFLAHEAQLRDPRSYAATQRLGTDLRREKVEALLFSSARDPRKGANVALFTPRAFARKTPLAGMETWHCHTTAERVIFRRRNLILEQTHVFPSSTFESPTGQLWRVAD